jgi:hypothetical protein
VYDIKVEWRWVAFFVAYILAFIYAKS